MSGSPTRWSTAASMAWWKKLLTVIAIVVVYLAAMAILDDGHVCSGPMSSRC